MTDDRTLTGGGGVALACRVLAGTAPGVMFLPGFASRMTGLKAEHLLARCRARGRACVLFDYGGHGASGGRFEDGTIGAWTEDALAILDRAAPERVILVGSSMGGWIMARLAELRRERIAALVGISVAPDFTQDLIWPRLSPEQQEAIRRDGSIRVPSAYDPAGYLLTRALFEDGEGHRVLGRPIPYDGPVHLLHGLRDADVPWRTSLRLAEALTSEEVTIELVKDGDHRLARPQDVARLDRAIDRLADAAA